ncbi:MAG: methyltransferase domain-containing protein [Acidobacteria bacterium]|nr:methyltransferase domain-containing protein [Acidobacteriota bacterium]
MSTQPALDAWMAALEQRHMADLRFAEVARALRAVSSAYVERRQTALAGGRVLDGQGKRAAFALYYGPLHFLAVTQIMDALRARDDAGATWPALPVIDVGCGTGAAGAAVALATGAREVLGLDTHPWALDEARTTYSVCGLSGSVSRGTAARLRRPRQPSFIVAGYVANELPDNERDAFAHVLLEAARHGSRVLVVEPLARSAAPWWPAWTQPFAAAGGQTDEWKLSVDPPDLVRRLGEAAGLTATSINIRTMFLS